MTMRPEQTQLLEEMKDFIYKTTEDKTQIYSHHESIVIEDVAKWLEGETLVEEDKGNYHARKYTGGKLTLTYNEPGNDVPVVMCFVECFENREQHLQRMMENLIEEYINTIFEIEEEEDHPSDKLEIK